MPSRVERALDALVDRVFTNVEGFGETQALVIVHGGRLVLQRYGRGTNSGSTLRSWSMAKSVLHAAVGVGGVDVEAPVHVPEVGSLTPPLTWDHLLRMTGGFGWDETYDPDSGSDVVTMLFGEGRSDVARFAAARPIVDEPGSRFVYSSGTSNVVSRALGVHARSRGTSVSALLDELFGAIGVTSAVPKFDARGTWIASSYCFATALDFARLGQLYLRDGVWNGARVLPEGWVDHARTLTPASVGVENFDYGAHWWLDDRELGTFLAAGFEGQYVWVVPAADLVVVRLGVSDDEQRDRLVPVLRELIQLFA